MAITETVLQAQPPRLLLEGLWRFRRPGGFTARTRSTRNHLIHLIDEGGYRLQLAGRTWPVSAPMLIWYHGGEAVDWRGDGRAVSFASCAFACPGLAPPPASGRVIAAPAGAQRAFASLLHAATGEDLRASLRLQAVACTWLGTLLDVFGIAEGGDLWDRAERHALATGRMQVARLAAWADVGTSTLERACRLRHGCGPGRRLRQLRLAQAEALVAQGGLSAAQAALRLGWSGRRSLRRSQRVMGR